MKIKNKLTYLFSMTVGSLLLIFTVIIYYLYSQYRANEFKERLDLRVITLQKMYFEDKNNSFDPQSINETHLTHEFGVIYKNYKIVYIWGEDKKDISKSILFKIKKYKKYSFEFNNIEYIGEYIIHANKEYIFIVGAYDKYGFSKLENLEMILISAWFIFVVIVFGIGRLFAEKALRPIEDVITQVDNININNLNSRVTLEDGAENDEIHRLASTFNLMLDRIEFSFEMQKNFVSNASHELRTPLTSVMGELEVGLLKQRNSDEYEQILNSTFSDLKRLNDLLNNLLQLAQTDLESNNIKFKNVRIDEIVLNAIDLCKKKYPTANIKFGFENIPDDDEAFVITANEQLLLTAILNVIDNSCKYANGEEVIILINFTDVWTIIKIIDKGIGIPEEQITKVTEAFYRASNTQSIAGHGIGLSLSNKIMKLHKGSLQIYSNINHGTRVLLAMPIKMQKKI